MTIICNNTYFFLRNNNAIYIHSLTYIKRKNKNQERKNNTTNNNGNSIPYNSNKQNKINETKNKNLLKTNNDNSSRNPTNYYHNSNLNTWPPPKPNNINILLMKNQEIKKNPITLTIKKSLIDLPTPSSISFIWNIGFLLGIILTLQIITGLFLSIIYSTQTETVFKVIVIIIRDVNEGWVTRIIHTNGASLFFIIIYAHTARGIYFSSPANQPKVWTSGVALILIIIATAFLGYVLPWGQISFWGATVITGVLSAIPIVGTELVVWIWGGSSVSEPTLNRFFSLHFILPIIITATAIIHLILLHEKGSSNPTNTKTNIDKVKFNPLFSVKDSIPIIFIIAATTLIISNNPNVLGDVENFNPANPIIAPIHIQPEWYFLFAYVILRSIPSKLGGVIALAISILIITIIITKKRKTRKFTTEKKTKFWILVSIIIILTWIGAKPVERPFEGIGQIYTILYFLSVITI